MVLELHVAGPGLDGTRTLKAGQAQLVLGRDADCDICLPDPQRNVSRRHLAVWLEDGELHFHVLSEVNGVEMPFGEAPPGARGVLAPGQTLKVGDYELTAEPIEDGSADAPADPWAVFDRDGSGVAPVPPAARVSFAAGQTGGFSVPASPEDDPFGEWGFETTFGPGGDALEAGGLHAGDVSAFFRGLGLEGNAGALSDGELESIGRLVRILVLGVLELHTNTSNVKQDLRAEDRTMVATRDNNPLKTDWPSETKLRYLFGGRLAAVGFSSPERAVRELVVELIAHNNASGAASRSALESTLKEFAPSALKAKLLGGGTKLFEGTRAWDAYCKYYDEHGADMPKWVQRLLDRYFTEAYLRESLRIRRETPTRGR
jgi:predicted component of type VI protein secretion system